MRRQYAGMSGGAGAGKVLGAAREILLARFFGTGVVADAYRASLTLTLSPVHLVSTHVLQTCFIPLHVRLRAADPARAAALFQALLLLFAALGLFLAAGLFLLAEVAVAALLPGFDPLRQATTVSMVRIMAIGIPAYIVCALLASLGVAQRDFLIPSVRPGLQNVGMVLMISAAAVCRRPVLAAYGFTGTYVALALGAALYLRGRGLLPAHWSVTRAVLLPLARALWRPLRPLLLLSVFVQGNLIAERLIASLIGAGTVAAMDYARFVTDTSHTLILIPLGLMSLGHFADLETGAMYRRLDRLLAALLILLVPLSAFLVMNGESLLRLLYQRGEFDAHSLSLTHRALRGLSAGLWAVGASYFLRSVLSARLRNPDVLRGESLAVILSLTFILLTYRSLGITALGLGPTLGACASLLYYMRQFGAGIARGRRHLGLLLLATAPYLLAAAILRGLAVGLTELAAQLLMAALFWSAWFRFQPTLRATAADLLGRRSD